MIQLSPELRAALNATANRPLDLYEFHLDSGVRYYSTEDITWGGNRYLPYVNSRSAIRRVDGGEFDRVTVSLANVDTAIAQILTAEEIEGRRLVIRKIDRSVAGDSLVLFSGVMERVAKIDEMAAEVSATQVIASIEHECPSRTFSTVCPWKFKGDDCGYSGAESACDKSWARCSELGNTARYGGFRFFPHSGSYQYQQVEKSRIPFLLLFSRKKTKNISVNYTSIDDTPYDVPLPIVLGRAQLAGIPIQHADEGGELKVLAAFCVGTISSFQYCRANGELVADWTGHHGQDGGTTTQLVDPRFPASYPYHRVAYVGVTLPSDVQTVDSAPSIDAVVIGSIVDFYNASGQYAGFGWTDNPAWCVHHFMTLPLAQGGMGLPVSEFDYEVLLATAAYCDQLIPDTTNDQKIFVPSSMPEEIIVGENYKRYRSTGVLGQSPALDGPYEVFGPANDDTSTTPATVMVKRFTMNCAIARAEKAVDLLYKKLLPSFRGYITFSKTGKIQIRSEQPVSNTTVSEPSEVGALVITAATPSAFEIGDRVLVGALTEHAEVLTVSSRTSTALGFASATQFAHAAGELIHRVALDFDDASIVGSLEYPLTDRQPSTNQIKIKYVDAPAGFEARELQVNDYEHQERVHKINSQEVDGSAIDSYFQAYRIGQWARAKVRDLGKFCSFRADIKASPLEIGDVIAVSAGEVGLQAVPFRVIEIAFEENDEVSIVGQVYSQGIYDDGAPQATVNVPSIYSPMLPVGDVPIGDVTDITVQPTITAEGVSLLVGAVSPEDTEYAGVESFLEIPQQGDADPEHPTMPGQLYHLTWIFSEPGLPLTAKLDVPLPPEWYLKQLPNGKLTWNLYLLSRSWGYSNRFRRLTSLDPQLPENHTPVITFTLDFADFLQSLNDPLGDVTILSSTVGPASNGGVTIAVQYRPPNVGALVAELGSFKGVTGHTTIETKLTKSHGEFIYEGNPDPTAVDAIGHASLVIDKPETLPAKVVVQLPSFDTETKRVPVRIGWDGGDAVGVPSGWGAVVTVTAEALEFSEPAISNVAVETKNVPGEGWKYRLAITLAGTFVDHPNYEAAKVYYRDPEDPLPATPAGWLDLRLVAIHTQGAPSLTVYSDWHPLIPGTNVSAQLRAQAYETGGDNPQWSEVYGPVVIALPKDDARDDAGHAHNFAVALDGYHSDGNGAVYAKLNVTFSPLAGNRYVYGIWECRGETAPATPGLWAATDANFISSPGTMWVPVPDGDPVTIFYALVVSDRDAGVWITPADYVSDPLPTASITLQPRGPADQVTNFVVTVGTDLTQDVPQGYFNYAFDLPADPDFYCVDMFRRPADENGVPVGEWEPSPVHSTQAPGRQSGTWNLPATPEYWIFKAVSINDLLDPNEVNPPTCFVVVEASAEGVKASRFSPGAAAEDGPLAVNESGKLTIPIGAIVSDHIESLAVNKLNGLIQSDQIDSIVARKISGTITSDQIGSIAASKISGTITSNQIDSIAASKISGTLQANQIDSLAATQITGSIQANQIASLAATQITGVIVTNQLADSILNSARMLGANLALPVYVASLPTLPSADYPVGTLVLRTSDKTLWENVSGTWTAKTASESLTGKIAAADVVSVNASTLVGLITAAQIQSINAEKVTGTITSDQIASIAASKISGAITSNQINSIEASKISGSISSDQISGISASKISGAISSDQIASIAASKITGTISANQIGSINATSITGTIVATQIGAVNATVVVVSQAVPFSNVWTSGGITAVGSIYSDTGNIVASNGTLRGAALHITGGSFTIDNPVAFRAAIGAAAGPVAWADLTGKPSVFPPATHTHEYAAAVHGHTVQVTLGINKEWVIDQQQNPIQVVTDVWVSSVTVS